MSHPYFFRASLALSVVPLFFGVNALLRPAAHLQSLGFPAHTEPKARNLNLALMRIWGIRNVSIGFLLTLMWSYGNEKMMGLGLFAGLAISITDGFVSRLLIGGGEGQHWMFPPIIGLVMAGLFGWF